MALRTLPHLMIVLMIALGLEIGILYLGGRFADFQANWTLQAAFKALFRRLLIFLLVRDFRSKIVNSLF